MLKKIFFKKTWNISYKQEDFNQIDSIKNFSKNNFLIESAADPQYFKFMNKSFLIYEKISRITNKGTINILDLENNKNFQILKKRYNLSFPSIHIIEDKILLFCECAESGLFKYWQLNENFKVVKEIVAFNEPVIDPVVLKIIDGYLIIGCNRLNSSQDYGSIFYKSEDLINWFKVSNQEINIKKGHERNAGQIYKHKDSYFRFSQILEPIYGSGVAINKINSITNNRYSENNIKEIRIESSNNITGIHTISPDEKGYYFDYRIEKFNLFALVYKVSKYCRKIVIKLFPPKS